MQHIDTFPCTLSLHRSIRQHQRWPGVHRELAAWCGLCAHSQPHGRRGHCRDLPFATYVFPFANDAPGFILQNRIRWGVFHIYDYTNLYVFIFASLAVDPSWRSACHSGWQARAHHQGSGQAIPAGGRSCSQEFAGSTGLWLPPVYCVVYFSHCFAHGISGLFR